ASSGGAGESDLSAISSYGEKLGLLFQMKDDLLDVTKSTEELGKTAGKDMAAAKATYPSASGIERTEMLARQVHGEAKKAVSNLEGPSLLLDQLADLILTRNA